MGMGQNYYYHTWGNNNLLNSNWVIKAAVSILPFSCSHAVVHFEAGWFPSHPDLQTNRKGWGKGWRELYAWRSTAMIILNGKETCVEINSSKFCSTISTAVHRDRLTFYMQKCSTNSKRISCCSFGDNKITSPPAHSPPCSQTCRSHRSLSDMLVTEPLKTLNLRLHGTSKNLPLHFELLCFHASTVAFLQSWTTTRKHGRYSFVIEFHSFERETQTRSEITFPDKRFGAHTGIWAYILRLRHRWLEVRFAR